MFLLVIYSRRCFWKLICRAANRTVAETYQKKKELIAKRTGSASRNDNSGFMSYLQELAVQVPCLIQCRTSPTLSFL